VSPVVKKQEEEHPEYFEPITPEMKIQSETFKTLKITNLKKKFSNGKVAVDNLNLEMFTDQIFSLLGHNGAGKTTTISMISGLLVQSAGKIQLFGKESSKNKIFMKSQLGVCPQKNPIFMQLTVYEHLILYSKIKHCRSRMANDGTEIIEKYNLEKSEKEIETILRDIDLWDKRNNIARELSGGQKRKLCVALAFVGGSKVILLDEPTSGMDTFARRHLWEMLKLYKSGRIIILTTHNMDEADYLGDRIGIMSSGKQVTCGSSMFLKNMFGVGYVLNIIKQREDAGKGILEEIQKDLPNSVLMSDYGLEMKVQLEKGQNDKLQKIFENLEERGSEIGIKEFGISLTTLEDVFLKVGNMFNEEAKDDMRILQENNKEKGGNNQNEDAIEKLHKQVSGRLNEYEKVPEDKKEISFDEGLVNEIENSSLVEIRLQSKTKIWFNQLGALIKKRLLYFSRDKGGIICEVVLPLILVIVGLGLTKLELVPYSPAIEMNPEYLSSTKFRINDYSNSKDLASIIEKSGMTSQVLNVGDISELQDNIFANPSTDDVFDFYLGNPSTLSASLTAQNSKTPNYSAPSISNSIYYSVLFNTTYPNAPLVASNTMNDALFKNLTGDDQAYIKTTLEPMSNTIGIKRIDNTADSINIAIMFSLAFAFIPTSIILFFIKERQSGSKYQQLISGMYLSAFWTANFIVDFVKVSFSLTSSILSLHSSCTPSFLL
jgi:ATP-binding cassette subfamily A (ABC1) protein 3